MLVKTRVAKRFALWFVLKFGKSASGIFFSFLVINLVLSMFISATTVKATILLLIGWFIGVKVIFPMKPEERKPQIEGGMERLRQELDAMGKMRTEEFKSIAIFVGVLIMWVTENMSLLTTRL